MTEGCVCGCLLIFFVLENPSTFSVAADCSTPSPGGGGGCLVLAWAPRTGAAGGCCGRVSIWD